MTLLLIIAILQVGLSLSIYFLIVSERMKAKKDARRFQELIRRVEETKAKSTNHING